MTGRFTLFLDYDGGTYVSQVEAKTVKGAIKAWTKREQNLDVPGLSKLWRTRMFAQLMESKPVAIEGLVGVFCTSARINRKLALLNLVEDGAR